jgi:hypothetical protein
MTDDRKDEERKTPSWQLPQERQPDSDAYHIWTPRPLLRSIYWKPVPAPPFEAVSASYEIFVDQRAWLTMHEHVWQTPAEKTPFGYLVGDLCEDPNANRRFLNITAALPARFDFREDAAEQISREATLALQLEVERRRGVLAGWYHRHLGGEVRMTEQDVRTHHQHFDEPWQCAFVFVAEGERSEGGCFRSTPEAFAGDLLLPFYEMASNESLLARGVKRSYLDWANYATVDEIRAEPPPRPRIDVLSSAAPEESTEPENVELPPEGAGPETAEEPQVSTTSTPREEAASDREAEAETESVVERAPEDEPEPDSEPEPAAIDDAPAEPESESGAESAGEGVGEPEEEPEAQGEVEEAVAEVTAEGEAHVEDEVEVEAEDEERAESAAEESMPASDLAEREDEDVDVDALIDRVRPARIELDVSEPAATLEADEYLTAEEAGAVARESTKEQDPAVSADDHAAALDEAVRELDASEPDETVRREGGRSSPVAGLGAHRKAIVAAIGGLLLVTAVVAGLLTLSGEGEVGTEADGARSGEVSGETGQTDGSTSASVDSAVAAPVTAAQIDSVGRATLATISQFYGRAVAHDNGEATCDELSTAYVNVEDSWIRYNTLYKGRFEPPLPDDLATRDERLYAGMQDVDREFERSGCPRP